MSETPEPGPHAAKRRPNANRLQVDGSDAKITFSPEVLEAMQELHGRAVALGHDKFDGDAAAILREMAYGKPISVQEAMSFLVTVCETAGICQERTGDSGVDEATYKLAMALNGMDKNRNPITVSVEPKARVRT